MTQTRAHIFLLESAQESHIGISRLLDLDSQPKPWKSILENKDKFFKEANLFLFLKSWQVSSILKLNIIFY